MILESKAKNTSSNQVASDLTLIINEFINTLTDYGCENKIPISMWVDIENKKTDLIRILNIHNPNNIDLSLYDPNYDITSEINNSNNESQIVDDTYTGTKKESGCNKCVPIKIDWELKLNKPQIRTNLSVSLDYSEFLFKTNADIVCSSAVILSQGCIPDLVKLIGMILMALDLILKEIKTISLIDHSFITASLGAVLDITIKKAAFISNISVSKGKCLSDLIEEILNNIPTSYSLNKRLDPELLKKFKLYNDNPTNLNILYSKIDNSSQEFVNNIFNQINSLFNVINLSVDKVNDWLEGLFNLSSYIPCERERSSNSPVNYIEDISKLMSLINTITAIIEKKSENKCKEDTNTVTNSNTNNLSMDDITSVISNILNIESIIKDNNNNTIGIILPEVELQTSYLDMFGCNLPTFMDIVSSKMNLTYISSINNNVLNSSNTKIGETEKSDIDLNNKTILQTNNIGNPSNNYLAYKPSIITIDELSSYNSNNKTFINLIDYVNNTNSLIENNKELEILLDNQKTAVLETNKTNKSNSNILPEDNLINIDELIRDINYLSDIPLEIKSGGCK